MAEGQVSSFRKAHEDRLDLFADIRKDYFERLKPLNEKELAPPDLWKELGTTLGKYLEWTRSLQIFQEEPSVQPWDEWKKTFYALVNDLPPQIEIPIKPEFWEVVPTDSVKVRLWKWMKKRSPEAKRTGAPSPFLEAYLGLPVARFLLEEQERGLQQAAVQLHRLHQITEKMFDAVMIAQGATVLDPSPDLALIPDRLRKILEETPSVEIDLKELDVFERESFRRFEEFSIRVTNRIRTDWKFAGTFILPDVQFDPQHNEKEWKRLESVSVKGRESWYLHFEGEREDWEKDLELSLLQIQSVQICLDAVQSIKQKVEQKITPAFLEPLEMISTSLEKLQQTGSERQAKLEEMILIENRSMLRSLRREKLPAMMEAVTQAQIGKVLENYLSRIRHATEQLPDQHIILHEADLGSLRPNSKVMEISLKNLILEEFFSELTKKHGTFGSEIEQNLQQILREISEMDQIVEYNLGAALDLLQQGGEGTIREDAQSVAIEGLGRTSNRIHELMKTIRHIMEKSEETLWRLTREYGGHLHALADNEKIIDLKFRIAKAQTNETLRDYRRNILKKFKRELPTLENLAAGLLGRVQRSALWIRNLTGLAPVSTRVEESLSQFIFQRENQIGKLPYVYQRLFRIEPLTDERFFEGRAGEMEILKQEFTAWRAGQSNATALVGEKGSGRTTLLNFAAQKIYSPFQILRMPLQGIVIPTEETLLGVLKATFGKEEVGGIKELEEKINAEDGHRIIIVEDLQNLFIRTVDGFDALERFLLFLSRTHGRLYWVVTCSLYSWHYLDQVLQISKYFQRVVFLKALTNNDVENIILKRHWVSGYTLRIETPEEAVHSGKSRNQEVKNDPQTFYKNLLFEQLQELGAGNISVTMLFWLSAIKTVEKDTLVLSPKVQFEPTSLYGLPSEELFTLAALLQHEGLNAREHALVFRQEERQSTLLLSRMRRRGILIERANGRYQVNPLIYRPIVQALKIKNILHQEKHR